ncbi:MAG: T9SS type A sorting domain-containing protein [Bacteroidales bacterium]|nr:T9SS type A sorting domain-containing protein [Bacteroidales bacterium]
MKTRNFFKTLFLLALMMAGFGFQAQAQYQSFFGDSITEYSVLGHLETYRTDPDPRWLPGFSFEFPFCKNDTSVINGKTYYELIGTDIYLREDTTTGRIYRYESTYGEDVLTCDMSLNVGDTFWMPFYRWSLNQSPVPIVVDTVIYVNGLKNIIFRKICDCPHLYAENYHGHPIEFVEGIGPSFSPLGWGGWYSMFCDGGYYYMDSILRCDIGIYDNPFLLCVHKDDELVYMADERAGCYQYGFIKVEENPKDVFALFPNPTRNRLTIRFESLPSNCTLYISDMFGRIVFVGCLTEMRTSINISHLQQGTYIATCIIDNKKYSRKFVKTR